MTDQIMIGVKDKQTANALQAELGALGIQVSRKSKNQAVSFGMTIQAGPAKFEVKPEEIIQFVKEFPPAIVDALFNTLVKFRDGIKLLINGKPTEISSKQEFIRNLS